MKFRKLLGGGLLAAVLALGGVAGLATRSESKAVKADGVSGTMTVDLTGEGWASNGDGQKISVYFWDNNDHNGWGTLEFAEQNQYVVFVSYSLSFTPTSMKAVRYSPYINNGEEKNDFWETDPWCSQDNHKWAKWNEGENLSFADNGNIVIAGEGYSFVGTAYLHGTADGTNWGTLAQLSSVKLNGSKHIEYYGSHEFVLYEKFGVKLFSGTWVTSFTLSDYAKAPYLSKDAFVLNESNQIECAVPGTYSLYFDRNNGSDGSIYITGTAPAAADEWAQTFLAGVTCDGDGSITKDTWSTLAGTYSSLDSSVKAIFEDIPTRGKEDGSYAEAAVARYDYILIKYGIGTSAPKHTDFMGRFGEGGINQNVPTAQAPISVFGSMDNSTPIMLVVIISVVSLTAVGGYIFLKRRKED